MHSQKGTEIAHTEIKADLALHLWEGLVICGRASCMN